MVPVQKMYVSVLSPDLYWGYVVRSENFKINSEHRCNRFRMEPDFMTQANI